MSLPGFTAHSSLYKSKNSYTSGVSTHLALGPDAGLVPQLLDCSGKCAVAWEICNLSCTLGFLGNPICLGACLFQFVDCLDSCPDGGGGGPPSCCPPGTSCRCGGRCIPGKGCIGGTCLRPGEHCQ
jgi:hypothetical protein